MSRGWTPIEDDPRWEEDGYYEKWAPYCESIARSISQTEHAAEQEGFWRQFDREEGNEWYPEDEDEEAMYAAWQAEREAKHYAEEAYLDALYEKLAEIGARMMRPYEHWNEDEQYMQYMENRGY